MYSGQWTGSEHYIDFITVFEWFYNSHVQHRHKSEWEEGKK